jgi:GT2 family glycosyltransferase
MPSLTAIVPATNGPASLARCLEAIERAEAPPEEIIVVDEPAGANPAEARNDGARRATGDILTFVDADVLVHADAFRRIRATLARDDGLTAVFGSYDDDPASPGIVSTFRNLLHHYVHQSSAGPATTFWTGLGAIRRQAFAEVGGFDERLAMMEDVDLGMRVRAAGGLILLDPEIQGTHLKHWTLREMIRTDFLDRGVPWLVLLTRDRATSRALNLGWRHRASALACLLVVGGLVVRRPAVAAASSLAFVTLNRRLYALLLRRQGARRAVFGVGLHVVHVLTAAAAVPAALAAHLLERRRGEPSAQARSRGGD